MLFAIIMSILWLAMSVWASTRGSDIASIGYLVISQVWIAASVVVENLS